MITNRMRMAGLALLGGMAFAQAAHAQVQIIGPETATEASIATGSFHKLIIAMHGDAPDLYMPAGNGLVAGETIFFHYEAAGPGFTGDWSASAEGGGFGPIEFRKVANFPGFEFPGSGAMDIGFIGGDDSNAGLLGLSAEGGFTELFSWNSDDAGAPASYQLNVPGETSITFEHRDPSGLVSPASLADPGTFRIYQAFDNGQFSNEWLVAVDSGLVGTGGPGGGFANGFFYVSGPVDVAIPEPGLFALGVSAVLGAVIFLRRRAMPKSKG